MFFFSLTSFILSWRNFHFYFNIGYCLIFFDFFFLVILFVCHLINSKAVLCVTHSLLLPICCVIWFAFLFFFSHHTMYFHYWERKKRIYIYNLFLHILCSFRCIICNPWERQSSIHEDIFVQILHSSSLSLCHSKISSFINTILHFKPISLIFYFMFSFLKERNKFHHILI